MHNNRLIIKELVYYTVSRRSRQSLPSGQTAGQTGNSEAEPMQWHYQQGQFMR